MVHCQFKFQLAEPAASLALPGFNLNCKLALTGAALQGPAPVVACRRLKFAAVARRGSARSRGVRVRVNFKSSCRRA